jgi:hypothetical protein
MCGNRFMQRILIMTYAFNSAFSFYWYFGFSEPSAGEENL